MLKNKWIKRIVNIISIFLAVLLIIMLANVFAQHVVAHIEKPFTPQYERVTLTEEGDYETILL